MLVKRFSLVRVVGRAAQAAACKSASARPRGCRCDSSTGIPNYNSAIEFGSEALLCRLVGDLGAAKVPSVPVHNHAGRFALPVSNKRQPDIIRRGYGVHVETGFVHWKEFGRIIIWHAANRRDQMISRSTV